MLVRQFSLLLVLFSLQGCAQKIQKTTEVAPTAKVSAGLSSMFPGVSFLYQPVETDSVVPFLIVYDQSVSFHVPWHISALGSNASGVQVTKGELVLVDPVNQTVSLGFDADKRILQQCDDNVPSADRVTGGYSVCTSELAVFPAPRLPQAPKPAASLFDVVFGGADQALAEKPVAYPVELDLQRLAIVVRQLNLLSRAEDYLTNGLSQEPSTSPAMILKHLTTAQKSYQRKLADVQQSFVQQYLQGANKRLDIARRVSDRSGFFGYDMDWADQISLTPLPYEAKTFDYSAIVKPIEGEKMNDGLLLFANVILDRLKKQYETDRKLLIQQMSRQMSSYRVICQHPEFMGNYQVSVKCPGKIAVNEKEVKIQYEILARRFGITLPAYAMHNADVSVQSDSKRLSITNNSSKDIWLKQVDMIGNGQSQSVYVNTAASNGYVLKPSQTFTIEIRQLLSGGMQEALFIPFTNSRDAARGKMNYGYRLLYQPEDAAAALTFSEVREYRLDHVLLSRY